MPPRPTSRFLSLLVFACPGFLAGCGGSEVELARVTGSVTRAGKPVANLQLHFLPENGRPSFGLTDAKGRFKLLYTEEEDGARFGEHRVFVRFNETQPQSYAGTGTKTEGPDLDATVTDETKPAEEPSTIISPQDRRAIIDKYGDLEKSPLRIKIEKNGQDLTIALD